MRYGRLTKHPLLRALLGAGLLCPHATTAPAAPGAVLLRLPTTARTPIVLGGVPRAACFPIEQLKFPLRKRAEALLLNAMDGEALYTLVGSVKPM